MKKETSKIFSGEYSRDMWEAINSAKSKADLQTAIYVVCCRLQEFETRLTKRAPDVKPRRAVKAKTRKASRG